MVKETTQIWQLVRLAPSDRKDDMIAVPRWVLATISGELTSVYEDMFEEGGDLVSRAVRMALEASA